MTSPAQVPDATDVEALLAAMRPRLHRYCARMEREHPVVGHRVHADRNFPNCLNLFGNLALLGVDAGAAGPGLEPESGHGNRRAQPA